MSLEIDVLPIGGRSSGGDAIALRYGNLSGGAGQRVIVIDVGYSARKDGARTGIRCHAVSGSGDWRQE